MSAFIVDDKTINRIVSYILGPCGEWFKIRLKTFLKSEEIGPDILGKKMLEMNHEAVEQRYNQQKREVSYTYQHVVVRKIQVFKSLQCFTYQCSEGNVPEQEFFKLLEELEHNLASEIVSEIKEYQDAEWG